MTRRSVLLVIAVAALAGGGALVAALWGPQAAPPPAPAVPDVDLVHAEPAVAVRIRMASAAARRAPADAAAWGALGAALEVHGFVSEAVPCYEHAAALEPRAWRWPYFLGLCLRPGSAQEAAESLARAARLNPAHVPLLVALADLLMRLERIPEAADLYKNAAELDAGCAPAWSGLGGLALRHGDLEGAAGHLRRAARLAPGWRDPHRLLAEVLRRQGEVEAAAREDELARLASDELPLPDPVRDALWWEHGQSLQWRLLRAGQLRKKGRLAAAMREWEELLGFEPDHARAHEELAELLVLMGRLESAREHHRRAVELAPETASFHVGFGAALADAGHAADAITAFKAGLRVQPDHRGARINLGSMLAQTGRLEEGIAQLRAILDEDPTDAAALFNLGVALSDAGRHGEAAETFRRLALAEPLHVQVYDRWALALARDRRPGEAVAVCRQGLDVMRDNATTANRLAWLLAAGPEAQHRDGAEALELARGLCEAASYRSPPLLDTLAAAAAETGDFRTAVQMALSAVDLAERGEAPCDPALLLRIKARLEQYYRLGRAYHGPP